LFLHKSEKAFSEPVRRSGMKQRADAGSSTKH